MKHDNYVALAVPVFLFMIALEWLADRLQGGDSYELGDSVASLGCGVLNQVCSVLGAGAILAAFSYLYGGLARFSPLALPADSAASWLVALLGVDFAYYWWHRGSHEINFLWAMHVVHHQSRRYNLTTALRQASFSVAISWLVYVPIALLGVPMKVTLAMMSINTVYQFWIHTRRIKRLGFLELFLNTPSHHRVHHGSDDKYIDKNYAGILISWDRCFGTFQVEQEEPTYGIRSRYERDNPGWANVHYWVDLIALARQARGWDKIKVWFMYPGWKPETSADKAEAQESAVKTPAGFWPAAQVGLAIGGTMLLYRVTLPWARLALGTTIAAAVLAAV